MPRIECTGVSAGWCPLCSPRTCRDDQDLNDDDCPLRSATSPHGEVPAIAEGMAR